MTVSIDENGTTKVSGIGSHPPLSDFGVFPPIISVRCTSAHGVASVSPNDAGGASVLVSGISDGKHIGRTLHLSKGTGMLLRTVVPTSKDEVVAVTHCRPIPTGRDCPTPSTSATPLIHPLTGGTRGTSVELLIADIGLCPHKPTTPWVSGAATWLAATTSPTLVRHDPFIIVLGVLLVGESDVTVVADTSSLPCLLASLAKHGEQDGSQDRNNRDLP